MSEERCLRRQPLYVVAAAFVMVGCIFALVACSGAGGGGAEPTTVTIRGQTLYSADGGGTTQPANFQFDVPASAAKYLASRGSGSPDWIAVTGQIRAGDILVNLSGAFNSTTKEFNLKASGYVTTIRIDITIKGLYVPSSGAINYGQTDVVVTDSGGTAHAFSTTSVAQGQDATTPISSAPTTATAPTTAQTSAFEGFWEGDVTAYYNPDGSGSSTPTSSWLSMEISMTITGTQFQERVYVYGASPDLSAQLDKDHYQSAVIVKSLSLTSTQADFIASVSGDSPFFAVGYSRMVGTLNSSGQLQGGGYVSATGQGTFATAADCETNATVPSTGGFSGMLLSRIQ